MILLMMLFGMCEQRGYQQTLGLITPGLMASAPEYHLKEWVRLSLKNEWDVGEAIFTKKGLLLCLKGRFKR